jgi:hypothetical protein
LLSTFKIENRQELVAGIYGCLHLGQKIDKFSISTIFLSTLKGTSRHDSGTTKILVYTCLQNV